ncbi:MAG: hypothetical protein Tsb009_01520 [Planctomycetaceae bacterium]
MSFTLCESEVAADFEPLPEKTMIPSQSVDWLQPLNEKLNSLLSLKENWDSYGGLPPRKQAVHGVTAIFDGFFDEETPFPEIVPTSKGNIQLEWHLPHCELEVEVISTVQMHLYFEDEENGELIDTVLEADQTVLSNCIDRLKNST